MFSRNRNTPSQTSFTINYVTRVYPAILIVTFFLSISCSRQITEPVDDSAPGRRDYVWTVDTITTDPFVNLSRMWGSGPNDLWAVGGGLYHFDGNSWSEIKGYFPSVIFGFSQNDIWAAGNAADGRIWHFNGISWSLFCTCSISETAVLFFSNIWGDAANNIYAVGYISISETEYKQLLLHYDGIKWKFVKMPEMRFGFYDVRSYGGKLVFTGARDESYGSTYKVLEFDGSNFKEIYSGTSYAQMTSICGTIYIYIGKKVYTYQNGRLVLFVDWESMPFCGGFAGRSTKDIFLGTVIGYNTYAIAHYNGTNIQNVFEFWGNRVGFHYTQIFDSSAVFLGSDDNSGVTFSITGKLKPQ